MTDVSIPVRADRSRAFRARTPGGCLQQDHTRAERLGVNLIDSTYGPAASPSRFGMSWIYERRFTLGLRYRY